MAGGREAKVLAEKRHNEVLEAVGNGACVRPGVNRKSVDDSVAVKNFVKLRRIEAQTILVAHVHRDGSVLL
jgi:hypothetical protein